MIEPIYQIEERERERERERNKKQINKTNSSSFAELKQMLVKD
jgi:hypothetical protein